MNFNWILDSVATQVPGADADRRALSFDGTAHLTYGALKAKTLAYAGAMAEIGLAKGSRLALLMYNDPEYIPLYLAAARMGIVPVRVNFRLAPVEVGFILEDSEADVLIAHSSLLEKTGVGSDEGCPVGEVIVLRDGDGDLPAGLKQFEEVFDGAARPLPEAPRLVESDPITLAYTSGTTGHPKGAVWTHGNSLALGIEQALRWGFTTETVGLVPGPIYHVGAFEALLSGVLIAHGTAVNIRSGGFTVEHLIEVMNREGVTDALLFSFMLYELLRVPDVGRRVPKTLKRLLVGGDTVMPWAFREAREKLPGVELYQLYGLTEGGAVCTVLDDAEVERRQNSIGRPLPLSEAQIVRADGALAKADEIGEIWVRGPAVSQGYWKRPEVNEEVFVDGWCRTGDLATVDADGYIFLAGRAKDMIRSGAENIYPAEVEKVLTDHDSIEDAAVIAVSHPRYNEVGCAVLVLAPGAELDEEELTTYCRASLAGYKVPRHFVTVPELPRTPSGKVLKYVLREQHEPIVAGGHDEVMTGSR